MSDYFWETEHIRLRQIEPDDWEIFYEWDFDSQVMRDLDEIHFPKSKERYQQWAQEKSKQEAQNDKFFLVIEACETNIIAGSINTQDTDKRVGTFGYGVAIRPDYQRKGYATEAILLLLNYFFEELRYQKCTVNVHEWNSASIKLHERIGFVKEGQHRRMLYTQGRYWDVLYYGMTIEEWREKYKTD